MVATNLLLTIGFSIVTNFARLVPIPEQDVPRTPDDLRIYAVGPGHSPVDFRMVNKASKAAFDIVDASISYFQSSGDYFFEQRPERIGQYAGQSMLTLSDALQLSSNALQRLVKTSIPLTNGPPAIRQAGVYRGEHLPFFRVEWPPPSGRKAPVGARMDIDGRTGKVLLLNLMDTVFLDIEETKRIMSLAYTPDPPRQRPPIPGLADIPRPTTNQVIQAISNWLVFCGKLGVNPGERTNLGAIDWENTGTARNFQAPTNLPTCWIFFTNGVGFETVGSTIISFWSPEEDYISSFPPRDLSAAQWPQLPGGPVGDWHELARKLESALVSNMGIPPELLAPFTATTHAPETIGSKQLPVEWRIWPSKPSRPDGMTWIKDTRLGFTAGFDLQTGELKSLSFHDRRLIDALGRAQGKPN